MSRLKVVSWNVNGMANPVKRRIIFNKLRAQKADVYLIQESHSTTDSSRLWSSEWGGQAFYSHGTPSSRGVAIFVSRHVSIKILSQVQDDRGRFIGMNILHGEHELSIASVYAPTQDKPKEQIEFLEGMDERLNQLEPTNLVVAGDFNCILDSTIDKNTAGEGHPQGDQGRNALKSLMDEWNLLDVWRVRHPQEKAYTFRRGDYTSRLDYFLIHPHLADISRKENMVNLSCSDHSLITIQFNFDSSTDRGPGFWRFNTDLLNNESFVQKMKDFLKNPQEPFS